MLGKLNAITTYIAWILLVAMIASFVLGYFGIKFEMPVYYVVFGGFFLFAFIHFALAFWVRCPNCNKCLTIQGMHGVHPASMHKSWSSVICHWFSGSVGCIHCGATVSTNDL